MIVNVKNPEKDNLEQNALPETTRQRKQIARLQAWELLQSV